MPLSNPVTILSSPTAVPPPPPPRPLLRSQNKRRAENTPAAVATNPGPINAETPSNAATSRPAALNPEDLPTVDLDVDATSVIDVINGDAVDVNSVVGN